MSSPVAEGEVLAGKYRVERVLGRGGMGVVVAAMHLQLNQRVAIKLLLEGASADVVERFLREARAAVRLKSEHVARVIDVGALPSGAPYMVMEYLEGSDLSAVVRGKGALGVPEAVEHLLHACEAIGEAHACGIVHRDLKPANLFLTRAADGSSTVKVLDFGISKVAGAEGEEEGALSLTKTSAVLGSPLYMSPEQMKAARSADARSDIWSLGSILYELLTGSVPFNAMTFTELVLMVNMEAPRSIAKIRADVPPELEAAVFKCLEKKPESRFANVAELAWAIAPFGPPQARTSAERVSRTLEAAGLTSGSPRSLRPSVSGPEPTGARTIGALTTSAPTAEPAGRGRWMAVGGAALAIAIGATAAFFVMQKPVVAPAHADPPLAATTAPAATVVPAVVPTATPSATPTAVVVAAPSATAEPAATVVAPHVTAHGKAPTPSASATSAPTVGKRPGLEMIIK